VTKHRAPLHRRPGSDSLCKNSSGLGGAKSADPRTIGNCAIRAHRGGRRGWRTGDLAKLATCGGRHGGGAPAGPDAAPEWARVQRAAAGHDDPHGAGRGGGGGTAADGSRGRITMTSFGTVRPCKLAKALMS